MGMSSPTRRWILVAVALAAVLALGATFVVQRRADAAWQAMQTEVAALEAELAAGPTRRAPLWGEPGPGNAHEHYARATTRLAAIERALAELEDDPETMPPDSLRAEWQPALAALRAGAAATDVARARPAAGRADPAERLLGWQALARCAAFEARLLRRAGADPDAARRLLDTAAFGADLMREGTLLEQRIGLSMLERVAADLTEPALAELDRNALDLLATGLAQLDATLPPTDARADLLFLAGHLLVAARELPGAVAWQHAFSTRWMVGEAFTTMAASVRRVADGREAAWPRREAQLGTEQQAALDDGNVLVRLCLPNLVPLEREWRRTLARLRLLRLSVDLHRGVEPAPLRDPIGGGTIVMATGPDGVRLTCAPTGEGGEHEEPSRLVVR
jgi:hypothetical protein